MNHIRNLKKQARLRAATSGSGHQAELNAIAREHGHVSWGSLHQSLQAAEAAVVRNGGRGGLDDLIEACQGARRAGGHLVVLRPTFEEEADALAMLRSYQEARPDDARLKGIHIREAFDGLDFAVGSANALRCTIVAGSRGMTHDMTHGHFVVRGVADRLSQINALYLRRDHDVIHASTAVSYALAQPYGWTRAGRSGTAAAVTIRKSSSFRLRSSIDLDGHDHVCSVCFTPFAGTATPTRKPESAPRRPPVEPKCEMCRSHRASTQTQTARSIMSFGLDMHMDMGNWGRNPDTAPRHVYVDGIYVPLLEWVASPALRRYKRLWRDWKAEGPRTDAS